MYISMYVGFFRLTSFFHNKSWAAPISECFLRLCTEESTTHCKMWNFFNGMEVASRRHDRNFQTSCSGQEGINS